MCSVALMFIVRCDRNLYFVLEVSNDIGVGTLTVAARKDVTLWKRFMPPLPRLLGGLFAGLLMVH